jgi:Flp pilus assembly protein TadG
MISTGKVRVSPYRRTRQGGSVTVEFALVLLPLFAIVFMTMDVGWIIFAWASIQEGAREGVRYAVTGSGQTEAALDSATKAVVQKYSFGFAQAANVSVDYYPSTGYSASGLPASLDGTAGATTIGNIVKVTAKGSALKSFGPIFRTWSSPQLSASDSDVLQ